MRAAQEQFEPVIVGFLCRWCASAAADMAGTSRIQYPASILPIRVNCSGSVDTAYVLRAILEGADGVFIGACHPGDCHYLDGNLKARRRVAMLKNTLITLGLEGDRVRLEYVGASEARRYAKAVKTFVDEVRRLGPNPIAQRRKEG